MTIARTKVMLATAIVACVVLGAVQLTAASAASLFVGGVKLPTGSKVAVASKAVVEEPVLFNARGLGLKIECGESNAIAAALVGENMGEANARIFEDCSEIEPTTCKLATPTITTEPVLTIFVLSTKAPEARFVLEPKEKSIFATLHFVGSCVLSGEQGITGKVTGKLPRGQSEEAS